MTDQGRPRYELPPSIPKDETKDPDAAVGHQGAAADSASRVREKVLAKTNGKAAGGVRRTDEEDTLRTRRSFSSGDFSGIGSRGSGGGGWKSWGGSYRSLTDDSSEDSAHSSPPSPDSFSPAAWLSPRPAGSGKGIVEDGGHPGPFWGGGARPSRIESEDSLGTKRRPRRRAGKGMVLGSGDGELHSVAEAEATKGIKVTGAGGDVSNEACGSPSSHGSNSVDSGPLMKFLSTVSGGGTWASDVSGKSGVSRTNAAVYRERKGAGEPDPPLLVPAIRKKKTLMEKFGEMLEAAAETAVPSNPGDSAPRRPSKALSWEHWDAAVLNEFMVEEARIMVDPVLVEKVKRAAGHKEELIRLAKAWYLPFLSQSEFNKQKLALRKPGVGRVGDDGRCIPAASLSRKTLRTPITTATPSFAVTPGMVPRPPPIPVSSESLVSQWQPLSDNAQRANDRELASTLDGGWIKRATVLETDYGEFGAGVGGGVGGEGNLVSANEYYLVEVELEPFGGGRGGGSEDDGGVAWICYKRYSDFFVLWWGLCRLQPRLTELKEGIREGWGVKLLTLGGVLFPGAKCALERWRIAKLNGMLKIMLELKPRPQELVRFLEPHAAVRNDRTSAVAVKTASTARRNAVGIVGERSRVRVRPGKGRSRDPANDTTIATRDLSVSVAIALPLTPSLVLFLAVFAVAEAWSAMHAAGLGLVRSVEISVVVAWGGVVVFAGFAIITEARWLREILRRGIFPRNNHQRITDTGLEGRVAEEASVRMERSAVSEGGAGDGGEALIEWARVIMVVEILATAIVLQLYSLRWGSESNGGGGVARGISPVRDGEGLLISMMGFGVREAVHLAKGVVVSVMLSIVGPIVVAATAAQGVIENIVDGNGGKGGDVASWTALMLKEAMLRLVVLSWGGTVSLVCGTSVVLLPLLGYMFARLSSLMKLMINMVIMPFGRRDSVAQQQQQQEDEEQQKHVLVGSSKEEAFRKGDVENNNLMSLAVIASSDGKTQEVGPGEEKMISVDSPRELRWFDSRILLVKGTVDRLRMAVARAIMPKDEVVFDLNRNRHSKGSIGYEDENVDGGGNSLSAIHQQQQMSIAGPAEILEEHDKTPVWRVQGAFKYKGFQWASPAIRYIDLFAASVYASEGNVGSADVLCSGDKATGVCSGSRGGVGFSPLMLPGCIGRGAIEGVERQSRATFGSLGDVALMWLVVVLMYLTNRRECRLGRQKQWGRLALALAGKLVIGGWIVGVALCEPALSPGRVPALSLCVVEACRCVAALLLILLIVQGASENVRSNRSNPREREAHGSTTLRDDHLIEPLVLPATTTNEAGFRRRPTRRAPATARRSSGGSGPIVASGEKGGWFSGSLHGGGALGRGDLMDDEVTSSSLHDLRDSPGARGGRDGKSVRGVGMAGSREPWMRRTDGAEMSDGGFERE